MLFAKVRPLWKGLLFSSFLDPEGTHWWLMELMYWLKTSTRKDVPLKQKTGWMSSTPPDHGVGGGCSVSLLPVWVLLGQKLSLWVNEKKNSGKETAVWNVINEAKPYWSLCLKCLLLEIQQVKKNHSSERKPKLLHRIMKLHRGWSKV